MPPPIDPITIPMPNASRIAVSPRKRSDLGVISATNILYPIHKNGQIGKINTAIIITLLDVIGIVKLNMPQRPIYAKIAPAYTFLALYLSHNHPAANWLIGKNMAIPNTV